jgi:crotonobetainyl-CoA:carnitine CoA-transferase CaiB-like acyl-CoA transferase
MTPSGALADLVVVDLSTSIAGAWCSRLLADFGANVVLVEPPEGTALRRIPPLAGPEQSSSESPATSVVGEYVLANKRSLSIDLTQEAARRALGLLVGRADVVVESGPPGGLAEYGIGLEDWSERYPQLLLASITPNGQTGGNEDVPGNDLTDFARSGWASINGLRGRPPLKGAANTASIVAGVAAYGAVLTALAARARDGLGQHIDVAETDVLSSMFAPAALRAQYVGATPSRPAEVDMSSGPVAVQDGHFALTISRAHFWRDAMNLLGLHKLAEDRRFDASWYRQQHRNEYVPVVQERMAAWKKMELFEALATLRVVAGPVLTMDELHGNEHLRARGFWNRPQEEASSDGPEYPGAPFRMSATPWALRRRAPRVGEHGLEVLTELAGMDAAEAREALAGATEVVR